jgi:hypothetical protein
MSALTDSIGAGLDRLVEAQRGMTDWEADWFLRTGQLPDLSQPPVEDPTLITEVPTITEAQARDFLAGGPLVAGASGWGSPSEIVFKFDPNQKRDADGKWARTGVGDSALRQLLPREVSRLRELEELADSDYGLDEAEAREHQELLTRKRAVDRAPRQPSPQEVLETAPVGIAGNYKGPSLVCRPETLSLCAEERAKKILASLLDYRGMGFRDINSLLRRGDVTGTPREVVQSWVDNIDGAMATSRLPREITVMRGLETGRGIFGSAVEFEDDLSGFEWTEKAYVSTTVNPDTADEFGDGVVMNIRIPAGTGAIQLSNMATEESYDEAEMMLERGLKMRVVRDKGRDRSNRRILDVEVVPA